MSMSSKDARKYFGAAVERCFLDMQSTTVLPIAKKLSGRRVYYVDSSTVCARLHFMGRYTIEEDKALYGLASRVLPQFARRRKCSFCFGSIMPLSKNEVHALFGDEDKLPSHAIVKARDGKCKSYRLK